MADEEKEAAPAKKSNKLIYIIAAVLVAGGAFMMTKGKKSSGGGDEAAHGEEKAAESEKGKEAEGEGHGEGASSGKKGASAKNTHTLDGFVVNLNEPEANRYLKLTMEFELSGPDVVNEIEANNTAIRDAILSYMSNLTLSQTQGSAAKDEIKEAIKKKVNEFLKDGEVRKVYFTEFVVQ